MVLASQKFRDIEYLVPRAFFEQAGHSVITASSQSESIGRFGFRVANDLLIQNVDVKKYDGIFMVGGAGSLEYLDSVVAKTLFEKFLSANKPIAAICAAPKNFLKWGFLTGKSATGHNGDGTFVTMAKEFGVNPLPDKTTVREGLILTGNGPEASEECALAFMAMITSGQ